MATLPIFYLIGLLINFSDIIPWLNFASEVESGARALNFNVITVNYALGPYIAYLIILLMCIPNNLI